MCYSKINKIVELNKKCIEETGEMNLQRGQKIGAELSLLHFHKQCPKNRLEKGSVKPMKKRFLASATAFALILSLLPVASLGAEAPPAENSSVATTVEDAILYPSEESGSLDYNVVYTSKYDSEV